MTTATPQILDTPNDDRFVLLVDDDRALLNSYRRILVRNGYNVMIARSADEALNIARQRPFTVAIVD